MMFVKDALPATPSLGYCEYFFTQQGGDLGFDPADPVTMPDLARARARNMVQQATLHAIDAAFSPTAWQRSRYPAAEQQRIAICHEGVDIVACRPDAAARFKLPDGRVIKTGDPVVTYVARSLEPYRGFPQFMRAAAEVARQRKDALFVVAGGDDVSYGRAPPKGKTWRQAMMAETGIDRARIVFLGNIAHADLVRLFQVSAAHVYLTVPFVLSWSMLEAMACGCLIVGSRTAPVAEVVADGRNGLLTDFFDARQLARRLIGVLDKPDAHKSLRRQARVTIEDRYRRSDCLAGQLALIDAVRRVPRHSDAAASVAV
jgi:glycosyltransferase involved in cell wall biosynthesis